MRAAYLLGRTALGAFFLYSGIHHFQEREQMTQYAAAKGVDSAELAVTGTGALLTVSGLSLLLGASPKLGALGAVAFLAGVSPQMHDFWNVSDPGQRQNEMVHFTKNIALLAATLTLLDHD
ncbi:MAG TPA: DoxX family protein [Terriglobales bacterium]|nr:DoxX family protein [Terriglobales bacterium]